MRRCTFAFLILFISGYSLDARAVTYIIDPEQSHIRFAAKMCEADLLMGEFHRLSGTIELDETHPENTRVEVSVDASSATFNKEYHREDHIDSIVKGEKFLHVDRYPTITFKGTSITQTSPTTANLTGQMTLVGQTHPFSMEVTFHDDTGMTMNGRELAAFSAYGTFQRSDFGINYALDRVGIRRIGDEVTVLMSIAATRK